MEGKWAPQIGKENKYGYNGKELNEEFGLGWNHHDARFYDPAIGRWNTTDLLTEKFFGMSPYNYSFNNPIIFADPTGLAGDLRNGVIINAKKGDDISNKQFVTSLLNYAANVASVWGGENGQDISKITINIVGDDFDAGDLGENENLLTFGNEGTSNVGGKNNEIGFMNINDGGNTAAHEFGHFLGLSDRYYDGLTWNAGDWDSSSSLQRRTTPIPRSGIDVDPEYDPRNNLYSNNTSRLTAYQISIANSSAVEKDYQKGRGYIYRVTGRGVSHGSPIPYKINKGKIMKGAKGLEGESRRFLKGKILENGYY